MEIDKSVEPHLGNPLASTLDEESTIHTKFEPGLALILIDFPGGYGTLIPVISVTEFCPVVSTGVMAQQVLAP